VYTLPIIRAMALPGGDELTELLTRPIPVAGTAESLALAAATGDGPIVDGELDLTPLDRDAVDRAREIARANGGVHSALESAREQVAAAATALEPFNGSEAAATLVGGAEHLLASVEAIAVRHRS
jgi:hypothetical protein